jgi:hypothetical protein
LLPAVEITGNPKAVMQYVNYEEAIVQRYGVVLEGWTFDRFVNPSELSTAIPPLQILLDALNNGSCKFIKLTREQHKEHEKDYRAKLVSGEAQVHQRKTRKDAGKKRKRNVVKRTGSGHKSDDNESDSSSGSNSNSDGALKKCHRRVKSARIINTSDDENDST